MDKEKSVFIENGVFFNFGEEGHPAIYYGMDEPGGHHAMGNKPDTEKQTLCGITHKRNLLENKVEIIETESGIIIASSWGWGK